MVWIINRCNDFDTVCSRLAAHVHFAQHVVQFHVIPQFSRQSGVHRSQLRRTTFRPFDIDLRQHWHTTIIYIVSRDDVVPCIPVLHPKLPVFSKCQLRRYVVNLQIFWQCSTLDFSPAVAIVQNNIYIFPQHL
ncbi:hypothetical protein D1872_254280 [compost metagenome]